MSGLERLLAWFTQRGRAPFGFQRETWRHYLAGFSGFIQAPTGMGKTLAAAGGPVIEALDALDPTSSSTRASKAKGANRTQVRNTTAPLTMLWITPLRALAADTAQSLHELADALELHWSIELRTSDTSASVRKRQRDRLPTVLITTPESLLLLLSYPGVRERFASLRAVIVDEWHELMSSKRGVQTELALARLRTLRRSWHGHVLMPVSSAQSCKSTGMSTCPCHDLRIWGLSATVADPIEAASTLLGPSVAEHAKFVVAPDDKQIRVESVIPADVTRFPWAGHLGLQLVNDVIRQIETARTTLVFTNTRSQSEIWFRALLQARPDWIGAIALHHGSIDRKIRQSVEELLRTNQLKATVCTASLDLGVDFWPTR